MNATETMIHELRTQNGHLDNISYFLRCIRSALHVIGWMIAVAWIILPILGAFCYFAVKGY